MRKSIALYAHAHAIVRRNAIAHAHVRCSARRTDEMLRMRNTIIQFNLQRHAVV